MTLIVTVNGRESIWMLADRRLTLKGRALRDNARKLMFLETTDGTAILGYAGLGATASGTEPADWMSAVLRGRNLPLEQSLGVLAEAAKQQLPRHMIRMPGPGVSMHNVIVPAFLNGDTRIYSIDMVLSPNRKQYHFRYTRHVDSMSTCRTPRIGIGGSGALYLYRNKRWMRPLLRMVRAYERGLLTPEAVGRHLAMLNMEVHRQDGTVGPSCIVAWRNRKGGGGHQPYADGARDTTTPCLVPNISRGMDVLAIAGLLMARSLKNFEAHEAGKPIQAFDRDEMNAELARLPHGPDERLK